MTDTVTPIIPTLYIIMRSDIADMNPGKAMAQAAHANADFDAWVGNLEKNPGQYDVLNCVNEWKEGRAFGRTLVLSGTREQIRSLDTVVQYGGITVDPTYPWRNYYGEVFLSNEITCSWAFVCDMNPDDKLQLGALSLHK